MSQDISIEDMELVGFCITRVDVWNKIEPRLESQTHPFFLISNLFYSYTYLLTSDYDLHLNLPSDTSWIGT